MLRSGRMRLDGAARVRLVCVVAGAFLLAYFLFLLRHTCFFASGPDSSGYLSEAKLLASGKVKVMVEPLREMEVERGLIDVFVPLGFRPAPGGMMAPTYPPGLPLHMVMFAWAGGWNLGPYLVPPLAAIGCLLLLYALARELGLSRGWSTIAPLLLAPTAVFLAFAMQPMSDVVATFWVLLAIWCALRARRSDGAAYAAGLAMVMAVAVRPTNALAALPFALAVPATVRTWRKVILGAIVPAAALFWLNALQYGSPFRFRHGPFADVLTWSPPGVCARFHLWWTMRMLTPVAAGLALVMLVLRDVPLRYRLILGGWFAAFFAFYGFYGYCPNWNAIRFLLPAFPAVIVAALLVLQRAAESGRRLGRLAATLALLSIVAGEIDVTSRFRVFRVDDHELVFPETVAWTARMVPPDAMVVSGVFSGAFYYYGRWTVRWDRLDAERFMLLRAYVGASGRRWYALLSDGEVAHQEFLRRLPGIWTPIGRNRDVTLYRLDS